MSSSSPKQTGKSVMASERRAAHRVKLAQPVRIRPSDPRYTEEVQATLNFSRNGLYFTTHAQHYYPGMRVEVVFPYRQGDPWFHTSFAVVSRLERCPGNTWGVALKFLPG